MTIFWIVSFATGYPEISRRRRTRKAVTVLATGLLSMVPVSGLTLPEYVLSLNPSFSIGSIVFLFLMLWKRLTGISLLSERDIVCFAVWNSVLCICLYASALGFIKTDLYPLGYGFSELFVFTAVLSVVLLFLDSPLLYIFILYILAYDLDVLASDNFFDYITDTVLFFVSIGILVKYVISIFGRNVGGLNNA